LAEGQPEAGIGLALIGAGCGGEALEEPTLARRLEILHTHLAETLKFYGEALGLKVFRKHLGWYVTGAPLGDAASRRQAKAQLCQIDRVAALETALTSFWSSMPLSIPAATPI